MQTISQFKLKGPEKNPNGVGARIILRNGDDIQIREQYFSRGYQSAVSDILHFGLGDEDNIYQLEIRWPDARVQVLSGLKANQRIVLDYKDATGLVEHSENSSEVLFEDINLATKFNYKHSENDFDDFERESLLPHKMSHFGPALAVGDVNNDGLDDFYVGGAHKQGGSLFIQLANGDFQSMASHTFNQDKNHEDLGAVFFDAENDGDLDLYVVSGGNEFKKNDLFYLDRFYENQGNGQFIKQPAAIPNLTSSGSKAVPCDFDHDGDLDLFVGSRLQPGQYPFPGVSFLLKNESESGAIKFVNATNELCPELLSIGMVTDALWVDIDNDTYKDLVLSGEWMPVKTFKNLQGKGFQDISENTGLNDQVGWWSSLAYGDFDLDGDMDLVAGNLGLNYKYKASKKEPFEIYTHDFDDDGNLDIVLGYHDRGNLYPLRGRECSSNQMPFIKDKFPTYHDFAAATLKEVYGPENISKSLNYRATNFATCYIENLGGGTFAIRPLPNMAQFSSVNAILAKDFDADGHLDIMLAGNLYQTEVETPRNDASVGLLLKGNGKGEFKPQLSKDSGLYVDGDVKNASIISIGSMQEGYVLVAKNDDYLQLFKVISRYSPSISLIK